MVLRRLSRNQNKNDALQRQKPLKKRGIQAATPTPIMYFM